MASDKERISRAAHFAIHVLMILAAALFLFKFGEIKNTLDMDAVAPEIMMVYYLAMAALSLAVAAIFWVMSRP